MNQTSAAERLESLKAGVVGAIATAIAFSMMTLLFISLKSSQLELPTLPIEPTVLNQGMSGAIAILAGFLFGVTYRYVIRTDQNPHLKSGAVLAFGLVRGLAQVDTGLMLEATWQSLAVMVAESILLFAVAGLLLDWAIQKKWVKPFGESVS